MAKDFNIQVINLIKKIFKALDNDVCRNECSQIEFAEQLHIAEHLHLLLEPEFFFVEHVEHLLVESVFNCRVLPAGK